MHAKLHEEVCLRKGFSHKAICHTRTSCIVRHLMLSPGVEMLPNSARACRPSLSAGLGATTGSEGGAGGAGPSSPNIRSSGGGASISSSGRAPAMQQSGPWSAILSKVHTWLQACLCRGYAISVRNMSSCVYATKLTPVWKLQ